MATRVSIFDSHGEGLLPTYTLIVHMNTG